MQDKSGMKSQSYVVDSSVIVKWLSNYNERRVAQADQLLRDVQESRVTLSAPQLAIYEVSNALLKGKQLPPAEVSRLLHILYLIPIDWVTETEEQIMAGYRIGHRYNMTVYDAAFVALAKAREAKLVTDNIKHQGKAKGVEVLALADY